MTAVTGAAAPTGAGVTSPAGPVTGLTALLVTYGEESEPDLFGDTVIFEAGSLWLPGEQGVPLLRNHNDDQPAAGRMSDYYEQAGQVFGAFELIGTPTGAEAATELAADVRTDVSIGVYFTDYDSLERATDPPTFTHRVRAADLVEVSQCLRGRMPSARVTATHTTAAELPEEGAAP